MASLSLILYMETRDLSVLSLATICLQFYEILIKYQIVQVGVISLVVKIQFSMQIQILTKQWNLTALKTLTLRIHQEVLRIQMISL